MEIADRNERIAGEIVQQVSERTSLTADYLLYHEERAKMQWLSKQQSISKVLQSEAPRFDKPEEKGLFDKLLQDNNTIGGLFSDITRNYEGQNVDSKNSVLFKELEARLVSRLLLKTGNCNEIAAKLQVQSADLSELTNKQSLAMIIGFVALLSIMIFYNTVTLTRTLSQRISTLLRGVDIIGTGNFSHFIDVKGDDELSDLTRASNVMASKLRESHTSIKNLEKEIENRRSAEREQSRLFNIIEESLNEIYVFDSETLKFEYVNQGALKNIGYTRSEMTNMTPLDIKPELTEVSFRDYVRPLITEEKHNITFETTHRRKDGTEYLVEVHLQLHREEKKNTFFAIINDITERKRADELIQIRMRLMEYAAGHTLEELLRKTLDEVGRLVDSPIGFYHFVEPDEKTLSLQTWSTSTVERFCKAEGKGLHYSMDKAGVWVDCIRKRKPVIHNDYASLPHRKGLPEGHAAVIRELVVPVIRNERIVAILGVGNKPRDYTEQDVDRVNYLADVAWHIIESVRTEQSLIDSVAQYHRLSEEYHTLLDNLPDGVVQLTPDHRVIWINRSMLKMLKAENVQLQGTCCYSAFWNKEVPCVSCPVARSFLTGELDGENITTPDGRILELRAVPIFNESGKVGSVIEIMRDVTEHRKLEAQLIQSQKMESVGRLAGGVAHDYNNMLTVIVGYSELALEKLGPADGLYENLQEIHKAGIRSTEITRQLLAFARKQTIIPIVLDLNETVGGMIKMLARLIGEDIDLAWLPRADGWSVKMDPSQVDQLLANLCVNARDAIDGVGKITIETDTTTFDEVYCADHPGFIPGEYVLLAVSDDGCGMDHDTVGKIFEPFFTTKAAGQGTGLGLAMVYGIVKQNNGFINVYSEPGKGTTFKIYLTRHTDPMVDAPRVSLEATPMGHGEIILVVEDEVPILKLAKKVLEELGYIVLTAETPGQALRRVEEHKSKIDLLITDVVMPEMNGKQLSDQLSERCPGLKTLFMSGYTANVIAHHGVLDEGVNFVQKPFSTVSMAVKVKEALGI